MKKSISTFLLLVIVCISTYGQNGLYLEYKGSDKGTTKQTDVLKIYSLDGNSLNERTNLQYPSNPTTNLSLKAIPDTAYSLYGNKTYLKMSDSQLPEYKIEILGTNNVNGYQCTKISLDTRGQNDQTVWITDQIPSYEKFLTAVVNDIDLTKLTESLKKKNLKGFPVRITYKEEKSMQYDFVKLGFMDIDKSWFSLDGYSEAVMMTSDEMKKQGKVTDEQFDAMKMAEMEAQKMAEEQNAKTDKKKKKKKK